MPFTNIGSWELEVFTCGVSYTCGIKRMALSVATLKASTLHVLEGTTAEPGLIFHWNFARRLKTHMHWLASYVASSRVKELVCFRSIGLADPLRKIIESGPPDCLPEQFQTFFEETRDGHR